MTLHFFSFTSDRLESYVETKPKHFKESSFMKMIAFFLSSVLTACFFFKNSLFHQFRMVQEGSNASSLLFSQPKHRTPISLRKQNSYRSAIASLLSVFLLFALKLPAGDRQSRKYSSTIFLMYKSLAFSHSFVVSSEYHKFSLTRLCLLQLTYVRTINANHFDFIQYMRGIVSYVNANLND